MRFDELFLKAMSNMGIKKCFGIIGGEAEAISFDKSFGVAFYLTRHEFAAGIMADVAGRLTGMPHMCWATFGPGLTNMATGVCSAMLDRSPMVACPAQIPRSQIRFNLTHQCIDNVALMSGITKSSLQLENAHALVSQVQTALLRALEGLPGPVYLSIPLDLLKTEVPDHAAMDILQTVKPLAQTKKAKPARADIIRATQYIADTKHPMIVIGNQVIRDNAQASVCRFAQQLNAPIICSLAAKGAMAAQICHSEARVIAFCGDGGFHSTSQDLETLARYSLPVVVVVLSDSAFGLIKYYQHLDRSEAESNLTEFGPVDFTLLAKANGVSAIKVLDITELQDTLEKAFQTHQPHLIEISVKYDYDLLQHIA